MILKIAAENLEEQIRSVKVHKASEPIFAAKSEIIPFKLVDIRTPAANIIKQEMLAAGGDCAVPAGCVLCATDRVDVVLLGTRKHYDILLRKLRLMPYFGMDKLSAELEALLNSAPRKTVLADGRVIDYDRMKIMGILNITPDSFYGASRVEGVDDVLRRAEQMLAEGADILDVGGESTRPGSAKTEEEEELARVVPVVEAIKKHFPESIISVDTYRAATAKAALEVGADIINDITAGEGDAKMLSVVSEAKAPIVLMHMRGTPETMQQYCEYQDVVTEVAVYLKKRAELAEEMGIGADKIILDPGIGFAKNVEQNLKLMQGLSALTSFGYPVLLAASRKSVIGKVLGDIAAEERLPGTIATSCQAVYAGANLVRVHDVKENLRAVRMLEAMLWQSRT